MKDPIRKDVLEVLGVLSDHTPHVRFGQLICNLATMARGMNAESIWDMEDDELLATAQKHLEFWKQREKTLDPAMSA